MKRLEFIKKTGLATVGLPLLSSFEVFSFTKGYQQVIYPPVDDRFETFDFELFEKLKKLDKDYQKNLDRGKNKASVVLPDGTYYFILDDTKVDGTYLVCETPFYSYFSLLKSYDKRGYITEKGLYGEPASWQKGRWYYFNKERKLEKTINYDDVSKFSFEEVEAFCLAKGMKLHRGYQGEGALIRRIYESGADYNCWKIIYRKHGYTFDEYKLDLQTGKVISYREYVLEH